MAIYSAHRLSFLLMAFSLSGCSSMAKMDTASSATAASTTAPISVIESQKPDASVITTINVDAPTVAKTEAPVLSRKMMSSKQSKSKKKKKPTVSH